MCSSDPRDGNFVQPRLPLRLWPGPMVTSAFRNLCEERNVCPEEWRHKLSTPVIPEKCLLDMTEQEIQSHYERVEQRAMDTREDRMLLILERAMEGRLERRADKVWAQKEENGFIYSSQVQDMLDTLRVEVSNAELHFLLRIFGATDGFDMLPDEQLTRKQWFWLVGEAQNLKETYQHLNPRAWEICYESMVHNIVHQKDAGLDGTASWPHIDTTGPGWWWNGGQMPGSEGKAPYVWGMPVDEDKKLRRVVELENCEREARIAVGEPRNDMSSSEVQKVMLMTPTPSI